MPGRGNSAIDCLQPAPKRLRQLEATRCVISLLVIDRRGGYQARFRVLLHDSKVDMYVTVRPKIIHQTKRSNTGIGLYLGFYRRAAPQEMPEKDRPPLPLVPLVVCSWEIDKSLPSVPQESGAEPVQPAGRQVTEGFSFEHRQRTKERRQAKRDGQMRTFAGPAAMFKPYGVAQWVGQIAGTWSMGGRVAF